jgi:hypothetical protein
MFDIEDEPYRFDVVTVVLGDEQSVPQIELLKSFWTEAQLKRCWRTAHYYD